MDKYRNDINDKPNYYDKILIISILLLAFGVIGGALLPLRIVTVILIPFVILSFKSSDYLKHKYRFEILFFIFWLTYGVISLFWSHALAESVKDIIYLAINFYLFFLVIVLAEKANQTNKSLTKGWFLLFLFTLPIAIYEFVFDQHLDSSVYEEGLELNYEYIVIERRFAAVTFGNINGYNTILVFIFPFIMSFLMKSLSSISRITLVTFAIVYFTIVVLNGSRAAFIAVLIGILVYIYFYIKGGKKIFILLFVIVVSYILFFNNFDNIFGLILSRFEAQGLSDEGRMLVIDKSIDALIKTGFFGVGAGNFISTMSNTYNLENPAPHNILLEVGTQYGLIILILFVIFFVRLFLKQKLNEDANSKIIVISAILMSPLIFTIDSSYLLNPATWVYLSSIRLISENNSYTYD